MPAIRADSPDAVSDRVVPTTAVEQYLATIVSWFGVSNAELGILFPNLHSFPKRDLGFFA
jgi:uncharacterized protein (DUF1501 family)